MGNSYMTLYILELLAQCPVPAGRRLMVPNFIPRDSGRKHLQPALSSQLYSLSIGLRPAGN